ncbi:MAG: PAS domain-containing sensor histidine kinase [Calothrix sp. MO_167.B12]|nr:PAS domain-containing sensor histidine kinase [Calothrix sp. MO_167.B12]
MSRNQQSSSHLTCQEHPLFAMPKHLENVLEQASKLELYTPETPKPHQEELLLFHSLYNYIPTVCICVDINGNILSVNQFGAESLGYVPEDLMQRHIISLFAPSDRQKLSDGLSSLLIKPSVDKINTWELRLHCPNSEITWVKVVARILPKQGRNLMAKEDNESEDDSTPNNPVILMVCEDITEHKRSEDSLRESEQRFHTMADHAPVMLWMSGVDTMYSFFNQSWLDFTGRSMEQELGWGWLSGVHPEDRDFCIQTYKSTFNIQEKFQIEYRLRRADGQYRWVLDTGVPRFTPGGNFAGYIGSAMDITERKLAEVALAESQQATQRQLEEMEFLNRLKDEFLSTVSHELRTPLTNMKMAIQMLGIALNQQPSSLLAVTVSESELSKANRYFQILNNECDREINLINNFLDLQRLDTNTKPLVMETIEIKSWLTKVVQLFQARNQNCCVHNLSLTIVPNLPTLICDPFSLERILIELLTNAWKFSPSGSKISLIAQESNGSIQLRVENYGVEIPPVELSRIFDKFYRIPSNDPWKQGGTGLGLALVKKLIVYLGGTISVASQANCTCFTVELPLVRE